MSSPLQFPPPGFDDLSKEEQLTYVEGLLNYMRGVDLAEIPKWHLEILEERLARYRANGFEGKSLEEFEQELADEFGELTETN
jgi:Putative addiction module component